MHFRRVLAALFIACFAGSAAYAQTAPDPRKVEVQLFAETAAAVPGNTHTIALRQTITEGWHTYWRNPGDSGAPTSIVWHLPEGWRAGDIHWPYPERLPVGPLMNYGYEDAVTLLTDITVPESATPGEVVILRADVTWLVCSDVCIPEEATVSLPVKIAGPTENPARLHEALFDEARKMLPRPALFSTRFAAEGARFALLGESADLASARDAVFFPYTDGYVEAAAPQVQRAVPEGLVIETRTGRFFKNDAKAKGITQVTGILVMTANGGRQAFEVSAAPGDIAPLPAAFSSVGIGLAQALLFAFLGGLILNLMPCVLPVLSMKALALAGKSSLPAAARAESLAYGAGVLLSFALLAGVLLALRASGESIGWGFQLQQPIVVATLALLIFAVGLNLSGLFEISARRFAGVGQRFADKGGVTGSFFTGVLAVAVATPCTAPFMAAATGFAFTESAPVAMAIFLILGLGFALPFALLGFSPRLLRVLPRPGAWMTNFRQALAFPMYAAAVWLAWVMVQQTGPDGLLDLLGAALALAFALWAFTAARRSFGLGAIAGLIAAFAAMVLMVALVWRTGESSADTRVEAGTLNYEPYSAARLAELRAQNAPVFINATAAWCITCLVNERVALSSNTLAADFKRKGVHALKADWTKRDPEITALLSAEGRFGVPLYLYYAPGAQTPEVLPQILTEGIVRAALES